MAINPNQGPTAAFGVTASSSSSRARSFDGSASSDADGSVARYDWDFGDGSTLPDGGPTPSHTYPSAGTFVTTLTVTDNESCSTRLVFTGQTASCNGNARAASSRQVVVDTSPAPGPGTTTGQPSGATTGRRAAAIKKCKRRYKKKLKRERARHGLTKRAKKKLRKKRKRCIKKAKRLPA